MILSINKDIGRTNDYVIPVVADWPGQLFIRKALTHLHQQNTTSQIPAPIDAFIPILGLSNFQIQKCQISSIKVYNLDKI